MEAPRDQNYVPSALFEIDGQPGQVMPGKIDETTGRILVDTSGGTGTVTDVSVVSANGFAGTVATSTTTPAITLSTTITGILKGNGTAISAALNSDLPTMTATVGGAVPTPPNNTTTFLRGDGTFATPTATAPGGLTTQLQYNNAGAFGGITGATTDGTNVFIPTLYGSSVANGDITIEGTSDATKTTSNIVLQPTAGFIGVGTTSPLDTLHIAKGGLLVSSSTAGNGGSGAHFDFFSSKVRFFGYNYGAGSYFDASVNDSMLVKGGTGKVGVGNVNSLNPVSFLTVQGNMAIGTNYNGIAAPTNGAIIEGNVGIGTSTVSYPLHIEANANTSTSAVLLVKQLNAGAAATAELRVENNLAYSSRIFKLSSGYTTYKNLTANSSGWYNDTNGGNLAILNDSAAGKITMVAGARSSTGDLVVDTTGNVGVGLTSPTASVAIKAGTAAASTAPLKFTAGTALTTPEAGAMEFSNSETGLTFTAVSTRRQVVLDTATQTLTNKRTNPRTASSTSAATLTPDLSTANVYYRTTQTVGLTIEAPTGTPVIGETIAIYVDSAGAQTLTMNATYVAFGSAFPASTTAGKTLMITAQYNGTNWKTLWANAV